MQTPPAPTLRIDPPTLVVHDSGHLQLAIDAARSAGLDHLRLLSAPDAACFIGPAWWRALMRLAAEIAAADASAPALEDVLDCGESAGRALEALRLGQRVLMLEQTTQWPAVRERCNAVGATLLRVRPAALDLAAPDAGRRLPSWLLRRHATDDTPFGPG